MRQITDLASAWARVSKLPAGMALLACSCTCMLEFVLSKMAFLFARQVTMAEIGHTPYFKSTKLTRFR